jgi:hypothetical protein
VQRQREEGEGYFQLFVIVFRGQLFGTQVDRGGECDGDEDLGDGAFLLHLCYKIN